MVENPPEIASEHVHFINDSRENMDILVKVPDFPGENGRLVQETLE
jgi:hypothetical protein